MEENYTEGNEADNLKVGSIIKRKGKQTAGTTPGKEYIIKSKHPLFNGGRFWFWNIYFTNDNGKTSQLGNLKNWEIISY